MSNVWRLCCLPLALLAAFAPAAAAQHPTQTQAQINIVDDLFLPLPADFITLRASDGTVLVPIQQENGGILVRGVGQKLTLEFAARGLKQRSIDLILDNAPRVYIEMMVDPRTGNVKYLTQKAVYPDVSGKVRKVGGNQQSQMVPPANNACGSPAAIGVGVTAYDTTEATTDGPTNACFAGSNIHNDVWFDFTAPGNGTVTISTCGLSAVDTKIAIYSGLACPPAAPLGCNDDFGGCGLQSQASAAVTAGTHYLFRAGGFGAGDKGPASLNVSFSGPPANDECADAITTPCNTTTTFSNTTATTNVTDPAYSCRFGSPGQGVGTMWFKFLAPGTSAVLDTEGSLVSDTLLAIYDGSCGSLTELDCDDDSGTGFLSAISIVTLTPGNVYYIQVSSFSAASQGTINLNLSCAAGIPEGDTCADPFEVPCDSAITWDNGTFTDEGTDPVFSCYFGGPSNGVGSTWLTFVATNTSARLDTNASTGSTDTLIAVYDGTCGSLTEIGCSEDEGVGFLSDLCVSGLTVGNTYYVQVASFDSFSTGSITLTLECPCPAPPANDECEDATLIAVPSSTVFDNTLATDDILVPCGVFSGPFKNVWFEVAGTGTTMTATTCNGGTIVSDTIISVFCADCLTLVCVAGNDDDCSGGGPGFASTVSWCSQSGANYLVTVGNFSSSTTPGQIQLDMSADGSACTPDVTCLPQGACCLPDGSCAILGLADCTLAGGTYQGDGTNCSSNAIVDGSFEAGPFGGTWAESSTNFGTPLCDALCGFGGGTGPRTGFIWAWFGGIGAFEEGALSQLVSIPVSATTLDFYMEIPVASGNGVDFLEVTIDGTQVFLALESDSTGIGYTLQQVALGAFADGGLHTVEFHSIQTGAGGAITNFFVDDVSIESVAIDCPDPITCFTLNYDTDDSGAPLGHGQIVDSEFDGGANYPVTITSSSNTAAILNSTTGPAAQDPDLLVGSGNLLILQDDTAVTECPPASGFYCSHNDDADGGTISFAFNVGTTPGSIDLVDIDAGGACTVVLTDGSGNTRTYTVPDDWTGDLVLNGPPGMGTLDLTTLAGQPGFGSTATATEDAGYDPDNVVSIDVNFGGSAATDNLTWCQPN